MRAFVHTAWASVLLFGIEGNTRALKSGTAIVQSRFYFIQAGTLTQVTVFFVMSLVIENRHSPNGARPAKPSEQENN